MKKCTLAGIVLFASLALNVFFVSKELAREGHHGHGPFERILQNTEQLQEPVKSQVKEIIASYKPELDAQMKRMKASRAQLQKYLKSSGYTREEADAQFELMQAEMMRMQDIAKKMLLDINEKLSPEDRVKIMPKWHGDKDKSDEKKPAAKLSPAQ